MQSAIIVDGNSPPVNGRVESGFDCGVTGDLAVGANCTHFVMHYLNSNQEVTRRLYEVVA